MSYSMTRRRWLQTAGGLVSAAWASRGRLAMARPLQAEVERIETISQQPQAYHGWPTVTRRRNGQLLLVCSGGREAHVCPFGRVELMRSDDDGATWTWPRVLIDGAIDDRDAGIVETNRGSILVTSFSSLAYEEPLSAAEARPADDPQAWSHGKLARWQAARDRIPPEARKQALGMWMIRSTDDGASWTAPYRCPVDSPHGPIQLSDGRLLYAGKVLWTGTDRVGVCQSDDDGSTWRWLADVPARPGDRHADYHELHAVETADGRLLVQIRNHNTADKYETLQSESSDGGRHWSEPRSIGVWGYPSHLLRLRDGRLVMSYGHRRAPIGNQARVSSDHGRTWSEPLTVSNDGTSTDLGYPSTVELEEGRLLSVWYERRPESPMAVLRQATWRLEA